MKQITVSCENEKTVKLLSESKKVSEKLPSRPWDSFQVCFILGVTLCPIGCYYLRLKYFTGKTINALDLFHLFNTFS